MKHYIDKDNIVEEINRRINEYNTPIDRLGSNNIRLHECKDILSFLDTLEVKEADLEKEIEKFVKSDEFQKACGTIKVTNLIAKYFFELGLNAQKGE